MTAPRLTSVVSDRTDIELAAVFERVWRARGYQTRVRFRGPDVHVDAVGKTPEGAKRELRIWITSTGPVTADKASAFVRRCERAGIEPYVAAVGGGRVAPDAHRPGLVVLDAPAIAVEIRETGVESFVRDLAAEGDGASDGESGGLGSEGDGDAEDPDAPEDDEADRLTRREALTQAGTYVAGGLVTYLAVERVSDFVQRSPKLRAAVARRVAWLDARLPDVRLPTVEWSVPTPQPLSEKSTLPNRTTAVSTPANATTIPYADLRERPETYTGTAVTYAGRVEETMERDEVRLALVAVEDDRGRLSGDVVARWPTGRFFDDDIGFRLLADERVRLWGVVAGEGSISGGVQYPRIDVSVLEKS
ncbi:MULTISPECIES: hypothetical protein [unclassified Haloferax]|uniref:hypothetical protein n=1 Tax=Haloferax TaxID=2251 RepID=UPI0002AF7C8B|nr:MULTISPECIES: hypothetical protein [unclassified Haloferax]ELZ55798.1 hypothetical protein C460_15040 [Haloferax sp. ATCC BAA-646]ELZ67317.1 hypothetical protein C459_02450 [Haloferax sp. ATCC BAA-645]ELZ68409.1 hypothetical protein C458_10356 [Haloferax sp. ATCC BAA-644]